MSQIGLRSAFRGLSLRPATQIHRRMTRLVWSLLAWCSFALLVLATGPIYANNPTNNCPGQNPQNNSGNCGVRFPPTAPLTVTDVSPDMAYGTPPPGGPYSGGRVHTLLIDPNNNQILYAVSTGAGVWKSTDAGKSWHQASVGLKNGYAIFVNQVLAIDGNNSKRIILATSHDDGRGASASVGGPYGGLYVSIDGAAHWSHAELAGGAGGLCPGNAGDISSVAFASGQPFVAAPCGLYTNTDPNLANGKWTKLPVAPFSAAGLPIIIAPNAYGNALFACAGNLVYQSTTLGQSWNSPVNLGAGAGCAALSVAPLDEFVPDTVVAVFSENNNPPDVAIVSFQTGKTASLGFTTAATPDWKSVGPGSGRLAVFTARRASAQTLDTTPGSAYDIFAADGFEFFAYAPAANGAAGWKELQGNGQYLHGDSWSMAFPISYDPGKLNCTAYVSNDGGIFINGSSQIVFSQQVFFPNPIPPLPIGCDPSGGWVTAMSGLHTLETYVIAGISQASPQPNCNASKPCPTLYLANGDNDIWAVTQGGASSAPLDKSLGDAGDVHIDVAYPRQALLMRGLSAVVAVSLNGGPPVSGTPISGYMQPPNFSGGTCCLGPGNPTLTQLLALSGEQVSSPLYFAIASPPNNPDRIVATSASPPTSSTWLSIETGAAAGAFANGTMLQLRSSGGIRNPVLWLLTTKGTIFRANVVGGQVSQWSPASGTGSASVAVAGDLIVNPYNSNYAWASDTQAANIKRTTDGGAHWNAVPALTNIATNNGEFRFGCHDNFFDWSCALASISFSRTNSNIAVAALYPGGVAYSQDAGQHWAVLPGVTLGPTPAPAGNFAGYPISVWYDDNPLFGKPSIYVALLWNRTVRVDGNFNAPPAQ